MADVTAIKKNLQVEELKTGAAASEYTMQKVGGSVNFWNKYYEGSRQWALNGPFSSLSLPGLNIDGAHYCWVNEEIYAIGFTLETVGTSGDFEFDLIRHPADNSTPVSLFTTRPKINFSAGNGAWFVYNASLNQVQHTQSGITAPVFNTLNLTAGDKITWSIIAVQSGGIKNASLTVGFRPR